MSEAPWNEGSLQTEVLPSLSLNPRAPSFPAKTSDARPKGRELREAVRKARVAEWEKPYLGPGRQRRASDVGLRDWSLGFRD